MRLKTTQRNHWAYFSIGACALLLPPLILGAAFYSMLASPDDGAVAGASAVRPESMRATVQSRAPSADPQPVAQATQPVAGTPAPAEGMAREPDSLPVQVQVTSALLAGANAPPATVADGALRGALDAEPAQSTPAALLPRALTPASPMPQLLPPRMPVTRVPGAQAPAAADPPSPESSPVPLPAARKHGRPSYLANLAGRNGARSETPAARRNAQPQPQQAFSWKNWLQQLGIRPHNTRG